MVFIFKKVRNIKYFFSKKKIYFAEILNFVQVFIKIVQKNKIILNITRVFFILNFN